MYNLIYFAFVFVTKIYCGAVTFGAVFVKSNYQKQFALKQFNSFLF